MERSVESTITITMTTTIIIEYYWEVESNLPPPPPPSPTLPIHMVVDERERVNQKIGECVDQRRRAG